MPDQGVPAGTAATHTSTQEWQSFEMRMRQRRADRCLLRAEAALEAGFEEEARVALEEAARLSIDVPDLATLRERISARTNVEIAPEQPRRRSRLGLAAAAVIFLGIGTAAAITSLREGTPAPALAAQEALAAPAVSQPDVRSRPTHRAGQAFTEVATNASAPDAAGIAERQAKAEIPPSPPKSDPPDRTVPAAIDRGVTAVPASLTQVATTRQVSELDLPPAPVPPQFSAPAESVAAPPPVQLAEGGRIDSAIGALPSVVVPVVAATRDDEAAVRETLAGYEAAFSTLSASEAARVWPSVDAQALSRAFDGLESQRVRLGRCSVSISDARASADCSGTVTWTPRIGGGSFTTGRRWLFELTRSGERWEIARADAR